MRISLRGGLSALIVAGLLAGLALVTTNGLAHAAQSAPQEYDATKVIDRHVNSEGTKKVATVWYWGERVDPPVKRIKDASMFAGETKVRTKGRAGKVHRLIKVRKVKTDEKTKSGAPRWKVTHRKVIKEKVKRNTKKRVILVGTKPRLLGDVAKWERIARCESGGNWQINTGNGYYGGLQFNLGTWRAYGGTGYPHHHSKWEQMRIAERVRKARGGYGAWPHCGRL